jgi:hypothetical protein
MLSRRSALLLTLAVFTSSLLAAETLTVEGDPGGPIRGSAPKTITLQLSPEAAKALRKLPDKAGEGPAVRLAIQGVKAPAGTSIHVFLNSPDATGTTATNDLHYVGNITSFEEPAADGPGDDVLLDAAPALRHLKKSERVLAGDTLGVTLAVAQGSAPEDASIAVEKVVLTIASQGR